jgi:hypothetical protein
MKGITLVAIMMLQLVILHEGIRLSNATVLEKLWRIRREWPGNCRGSRLMAKLEALRETLAREKESSREKRSVS